jgi:hypothetical protein
VQHMYPVNVLHTPHISRGVPLFLLLVEGSGWETCA